MSHSKGIPWSAPWGQAAKESDSLQCIAVRGQDMHGQPWNLQLSACTLCTQSERVALGVWEQRGLVFKVVG
jgi:hypothetical protein